MPSFKTLAPVLGAFLLADFVADRLLPDPTEEDGPMEMFTEAALGTGIYVLLRKVL